MLFWFLLLLLILLLILSGMCRYTNEISDTKNNKDTKEIKDKKAIKDANNIKDINAGIRGRKSLSTWQPSCQKVFEESGNGRKVLDLFPHFFTSKEFSRVKEIIEVSLKNGHICHPYIH